MASRAFAFERGGPKRLTVAWKGNWKDTTVELDGRPVLTIPTFKELKEGREVRLEQGTLKVQLKSGFLGSDLSLSLNGRPLPGSGDDPHSRLAGAYAIIYFVGGLSALFGLVVEVFSVQFLKNIGFGWSAVLEGIIFLGLALWVQKRHSMVGLALAVALFALDGIVLLYTVASQPGATSPRGSIIVRVFFLISMCRGFSAIQELRRETRRVASPTGQ